MTHRRAGLVEHFADGTEWPVPFPGCCAREAGLRVLEIRRRAFLPRSRYSKSREPPICPIPLRQLALALLFGAAFALAPFRARLLLFAGLEFKPDFSFLRENEIRREGTALLANEPREKIRFAVGQKLRHLFAGDLLLENGLPHAEGAGFRVGVLALVGGRHLEDLACGADGAFPDRLWIHRDRGFAAFGIVLFEVELLFQLLAPEGHDCGKGAAELGAEAFQRADAARLEQLR